MTPGLREQRKVTHPKKVDTFPLQHHKREFQVEIQNKYVALALLTVDDLDGKGEATAKMIHEAAISIASRHSSEKLLKYGCTEIQCQQCSAFGYNY